MEKHLVIIRSSESDEVKEFYITDKTFNYLKEHFFKIQAPIEPTTSTTEPEENCTVDSDDLITYIKHVKYQIFNLETDKSKLEAKINKSKTKYIQFRSKYFEVVNSMKKYSKLEKFSNFIDLPQEEVNALINYRKAWIKFKERRSLLLGEIKIPKEKVFVIDNKLKILYDFLKGINV